MKHSTKLLRDALQDAERCILWLTFGEKQDGFSVSVSSTLAKMKAALSVSLAAGLGLIRGSTKAEGI